MSIAAPFRSFVLSKKSVARILPREGLSLPTKVFLSFAVVIVAFGVTMTYALVHHRQTLRDLTLVSGGLLPVTLAVAEIRNTQELLVTTLESDPEGRTVWLSLVRQLRPASLQRTSRALRQAGDLATQTRDVELLNDLADELEDVAEEAEAHEPEYRELFSAIEEGDAVDAGEVLYLLIRREREISARLERVQGQVESQITLIARDVERAERQLLWALLFLTIGALVIAAGVTIFSYRALAPLSRLTDGVIAVGSGDLRQRVEISGSGEIGALAQEFNRMVERLVEREERLVRSERLAAIGRVASKVTHEIRNPLNVLRLNAEMLWEDLGELGDSEATAEPQRQLKSMTEVLERLEALTEEYLQFARLPKPSMEMADLNEIIEDFFGFQKHDLDARGIDARVELAGDLPQLELDEAQIQQVLTNLVRNACEAMSDGGVLSVKTQLGDDQILLLVNDEGEGMDPESLEYIFDPFFTTKERGTGLGLPLAQQIVNEHGGLIEVESDPGKGTLFTLRLPTKRTNSST